MSDSTFMNLTTKQHQVFEQIAIGRDRNHHYATIKALLRRGLIERIQTEHTSHYQVPAWIHIEWCEWCSQVQDES